MMNDIPELNVENPPEGFPLFNVFNQLAEGELNEVEILELSQKIKSDPGVALQYLMFMQVVSELSLPDLPLGFHNVNQDAKKFLQFLEESDWESPSHHNSKHLFWGIGSSLLICITLVCTLLHSYFSISPVVCHFKPLQTVECKHLHTKLWGLFSTTAPDVNLGVTEGYAYDRIELQEGIVSITFIGGAMVNIQAPASFEFREGQSLFVHTGKILVDADFDFREVIIGTPQGWIKHIGTEFCVNVNEHFGCEIQVMEGSVVVSPTPEGTLQKEGVCLLQAKQAGVIKKKSEQVQRINYSPGKFDELLKTRCGVVKTSSNIKIVKEPQQLSLGMGKCESDNYLFMICERTNVVLPDDFTYTDLVAGPWHNFTESVGFDTCRKISGQSLRVDSYLLHRDLVGTPMVPRIKDNTSSPFDLEVECTFERPIIGFIENGEALLLTDNFLGHPECVYPNPAVEDLKFRDIGESRRFSLSVDRRTLRMQLPVIVQNASSGEKKHVDQMRVLVESEVQPIK